MSSTWAPRFQPATATRSPPIRGRSAAPSTPRRAISIAASPRASIKAPTASMPYIDVFRTMFPEGAGYEHDKIERRTELSAAQRPQRAAQRRLASRVHGRRAQDLRVVSRIGPASRCRSSISTACTPAGRAPRRTSVIGYSAEETVAQTRLVVPVSGHSVESVNLKDPHLGVYEQCAELIREHGVAKGRIRLSLAPGERHAGLTVNEYETLLMRHDLSEVLRDPLRFMAEKAGHMLGNPRAIPARTLDYAKYDLVRVFNRLVDALGLGESLVENVLSRAIAMPASRFLRMKRSVSLLVSGSRRCRPRRDRRGHLPESDPRPVAPRDAPGARARRHAHALHLASHAHCLLTFYPCFSPQYLHAFVRSGRRDL